MAKSCKWFTKGQLHLAKGDIVWKASGGSTVKCALLTASATINQDTNEVWSDLSANEVSGTGYSAGGAAITLSDPATGSGTHQIKLDATDPTWTITGTLAAAAKFAIVYETSGGYLLGYADFDTEVLNPTNSTMTVTWDSNGILTMTAS